MKALRLVSSSPQPLLVEQEAPRPEAQPGEIMVRVCAAAVTPTEPLWYTTSHTRNGGLRKAAVLGHEFSGEIAEYGEGVRDVAIGQEVYGMNDWFAEGALAEYCVTRPEWIANKPQGLSHEEAASVPISALTAWQGLFERGRLQPGERVLIHGGTGAVGMFAVQLAHMHGAHLVTTVSASNIAFAKSLGADDALDYRGAPFEDRIGEIDLVFDTAGGDTVRRSWQVLKPAGRLVTVAADSESTPDERVRKAFFIVEPNQKQLEEVGKLLEAGKLQTAVDTVLPVSAATEAYAGTIARQGRGKLVISTRQWSVPKPSFSKPVSPELCGGT
jgi:NADPH:quinone reductase-like Zn-dependent oxidoreductase